nr:(+)-neomenthol dehydrogenase-like [Coffea arabica]
MVTILSLSFQGCQLVIVSIPHSAVLVFFLVLIRYAVVIEANKGIGFEICRQLASQEITVVLNARDERRGLDSFHKLKGTDALSSDLLFHQLDVAEPSSVASIAEFIKARFGRLDILVNNAGVGGSIVDSEAFKKAVFKMEAILVQDGVDPAIHGIENKPEDVKGADFVDMDKKVRSSIILNLSNEVLREVVTETSAKAM